MYVDLHLHSDLSNQRGDSVKFYSINHALNTLLNYNVDTFSFTEHDKLSLNFINEMKNTIKERKLNISYVPGIEITIAKKDGSPGHILVFFLGEPDLNLINDALYKLCTHFNNKTPSGGFLKIQKFFQKKNIKTIQIPHCNKANSIEYVDLEPDSWDFIKFVESRTKNSKKFRRLNEKTKNNLIEVEFSDCHNWRDYDGPPTIDQKKLCELRKELDNDK